jgi:UDP-N-acetyl-D-galactosamine dehydrogenase
MSQAASFKTVGVIGLGYVGLPLAVAFGKQFRVIGFDLSAQKIAAYKNGIDPTGEVTTAEMRAASGLEFTTEAAALAAADVIIVAVPTPVDEAHNPDFGPLIGASAAAGQHMRRGATVVFESTVYPGATEEVCVPVIEQHSKMTWKTDFNVGYSPERINPGDREHTFTKILKIVSGDTPETLEAVAQLYGSVVEAGVYRASSIRVAEAAKVIENSQRDINIAFMNELAIIFDRLGLDTGEVLAAAGTKWNFLPFKPGLVGGHCIGVDPYYLTHKAQMTGYHPEVILAGRRINDGVGKFVAEKTVKLMIASGCAIAGASVNVLGLTFKEDCPDLRNSRVIDIIRELQSYGLKVHVHDPHAGAGEARHEYGVELLSFDALPQADALVVAVAHREFRVMPLEQYRAKVRPGACVIDVKSVLDPAAVRAAGHAFWRL